MRSFSLFHGKFRQTLLAALGVVLLLQGRAVSLEAGSAKVEITPQPGVPLNGFGDRMGRSATAMHDTLWARALYLSDGETALFLVNTDLCLINAALRTRVLELAPDVVPPEHIILTATHTHNGPGGMEERVPFRLVSGRFVPELLEETASKIAAAMLQAYEARQRATVGYGTAKQNALTKNRAVNGGPIDEQIGVIRVDDADGLSIAILANLAAHPTSAPESHHYAFSADFPGFYYAALETLTNPKCVAMFLNGAEGNQTIAAPEGKEGWARTQSVGELLAGRVKEAANKIVGREVKLRVAYAAPELPLSIAEPLMPRTTVLQVLEIDDLAISFFPGEPCVELGLRLRQQALAAGYGAHFSVGLANDYLGYFVPREQYGAFRYENAASFYGPGIEDWFYEHFASLQSQSGPVGSDESGALAPQKEAGGFTVMELGEDPFGRGLARGKQHAQDIRTRYERHVLTPLREMAWGPHAGAWQFWPPFMDRSSISLPALAISTRARLAGLPVELIREVEGLSQGAGLPFDAVWLLNNADEIRVQSGTDALFNTPLCTMFAVRGAKAGADGIVLGRNLDWSDDEVPVITRYRAASGKGIIQVGFTWNSGILTGMNSDGVAVSLARVAAEGVPDWKDPPASLVVRTVLENAATLAEAVSQLTQASAPVGYRVLVAGPTETGFDAALVAWSSNGPVLRAGEEELLLAELPEDSTITPEARQRYLEVRRTLTEERIVGIAEVEQVLTTGSAATSGQEEIYNTQTQHSVVFLPAKKQLRVRAPESSGGFVELDVELKD
ncbi:MAG: neutral/alkaline non-lysosomal ceramidase N-terminal domain-containing protein [Candidatus Hydrogenedentes bacterium]|nr:neutral/alkaline non-lysosomal ceramidase N-terminal domain-containing protein [Candidatus Hydrogenedentota bacterium]